MKLTALWNWEQRKKGESEEKINKWVFMKFGYLKGFFKANLELNNNFVI